MLGVTLRARNELDEYGTEPGKLSVLDAAGNVLAVSNAAGSRIAALTR